MTINTNNSFQHPILPLTIPEKTDLAKGIYLPPTSTELATNLTQDEINKLSWLQNPPSKVSPGSSDIKMTAHELYDFAASKTTLEGNNYDQTLNRFSQVIQSLPQDSVTAHIKAAMPLFAKCAETAQEIAAINRGFESEYISKQQKLSQSLSNEIASLNNGERRLIPGGWSGTPSGHAILYCIERVDRDTYKFIIFNTGGGINSHPQGIDSNAQMRYQTFLSMTNIAAEKFTPEFFQAILELQIVPRFTPSVKYGPDNIYQHFLNYLNGNVEKGLDPKKYPLLFAKPQRAGTCSMKSIFATMRFLSLEHSINSPNEMPAALNAFKRFHFAYRRHALVEKCLDFFQSTRIWSRTTHKVLAESTDQLSRTAINLHSKGLLSAEELKACQATVVDIRAHLAKKKSDYDNRPAASIKPIPMELSGNTNVCLSSSPNISIDNKGMYIIKNTDDFSSITGLPKAPKPITADNVTAYLKSWSAVDFSKIPVKLLPGLHASVVEALRQLPIPTSKEDTFWKNVPEDQINPCLEGLFKLSRTFLGPFQEKTSQDAPINCAPSAFIEMHTALAAADVLCRRQKENKLDDFNIPVHQLLRFVQSSYTILHNPEDQTRLDQLLKYFAPTLDLRFDIPKRMLTSSPQNFLFAIEGYGFSDNEISCTLSNNVRYNADSIDTVAELRYYQEFLKNEKIKILLAEKGLSKLPPFAQICFLLTNAGLSNSILPKAALFLKNLAYSVQVADPTMPTSCDQFKEWDFEFGHYQDRKNPGVYHLRYSKTMPIEEKIEKDGTFYFSYTHKVTYDKEITNLMFGKPQNDFMFDSSDEAVRDFAIQKTNAHDELVRYLSDLETKADSHLETAVNQQILTSHILRPGRLLRLVTDEPLMANKILALLNRRLDYFISSGNWKTALVLVDVCNRCADYIRYAQRKNPEKYASLTLRNYRECLLNTILPKCGDEKIKLQALSILEGFAISQTQSSDESTFIEYAVDWLAAQLVQGLNYNNEHLPHYTQSLLDTKKMSSINVQIKIRDILENPEKTEYRNKILNGVASRLSGKTFNLTWSGNYPLYTSGDLQIDFFEKIFVEGDKFNGILPSVIKNMTIFSEIFSGISEIKRIDDKKPNDLRHHDKQYIYEIKDSHGMTTISFEGNDCKTIIKREINGTNYILADQTQIKNFRDNKLEIEPQTALVNKNTLYWLPQDAGAYVIDENPKDDDVQTTLLAQNPNGTEYYLKIKINRYKRTELTTFSDTKDFRRILVNATNSTSYDILTRFENRPEQIAWWAKAAQPKTINEIDLLDINLHFYASKDADGKTRLFSREATGFYISEDQMVYMTGIWPRYLVLENGSGEKKVVFRKLSETCSGESDFNVIFDEKKTKYTNKDCMIYDVDFVADKVKLRATSTYDALYLTKTHLATKRYKQALLDLDQCRNLFLYTQQEKELIIEMISAMPGSSHPKALAIFMRLAEMMETNHLKFAPKQKKHPIDNADQNAAYTNQVIEIYSQYLNNSQNITKPFKLAVEQEMTLMRMFQRTIKMKNGTPDGSYLETSLEVARRAEILLKHTPKNSIEECLASPVARSISSFWDISSYELKELFSCYDYQEKWRKLESNSQIPTSVTIAQDNFIERYRGFYSLASSGTASERKTLRTNLRLLSAHVKTDFAKGCYFLMAVCDNPSAYPSLNEMIKILKDPDLYKSPEFHNIQKTFSNSNVLKELIENAKTHGTINDLFDTITADQINQVRQYGNELVAQKPEIPGKHTRVAVMPIPENLTDLDNKWKQSLTTLKNRYLDTKNTNTLQAAKEELKTLIAEAKKILSLQEKEIISMANALRPDASPNDALMQQGRTEKPKMTLNDAVALFEKGNASKYLQETSLSDPQIKALEKKVSEHLIDVTRLSQFKRILNLLIERETGTETKLIDEKILEELDCPRLYQLAEGGDFIKRAYLVFEYRNEILLRDKQVNTLNDIANIMSSLNHLLELGTGSGKSKVLAPLMERLRQIYGSSVFNIWPSALYEVNKRDMKTQVEHAFCQSADAFEFSRETSVECNKLLVYLRELIAALTEGRQLNATAESLQSIELKFLELLHKAANEEGGFPPDALPLLREILNFIYSSEAHIDEGHIILSPRREVNFTVGDPVSEPIEKVELIEKIFQFLITDSQTNELLKIKEDRQRFCSPEKFKSDIALRLAEQFISDLGISKVEKDFFLQYVQGIKTDIKWLENHPKRALIILLREQITFLLPEVLQKSVNVNYGLTHRPNGAEYAKPYSGNDSPIENAEYDNIYETFDKTYLTYIFQGLNGKQLWKLVQFLQFESLKAAKEKKVDPRDSDTYKFFKASFPDDLGDLFGLTEEEVQKCQAKLQNNDTLIFYFIKNIVAPTIKKFKFKLKSTSANFRGMFNSTLAMTATPGDKEIYSDKINLKKDVGNEEKVLARISEKCANPNTIHSLAASKPKEILNEIKQMFVPDTGFRMLIDIGALLKGINNYTVARALLEHFTANTPNIKGVVFFDKDDRMMVLEAGRNDPIPFEQCGLTPNERFTYCDQRHSFGADIHQYHSAKGLATIDKLSDKDAVVQGVGRLRQFMKNGQSVEFALTKEVKDIIKPEGALSIKDLLDFVQKNQTEREKEDLRRALKQQMSHEVRSVLMKKLLACSDTKELVKLFKDFEPVLVEKIDELSGDQLELELTTNNLQRFRQELIKKTDDLSLLTKNEKNGIISNLKAYKERIEKLKNQLPEFVTTRASDLETEAEIQQNTEVDSDTNIQQQTFNNNDLYKRTPSLWPRDFNLYDDKWLVPTAPRVSLVAQAIQKVAKWFDTPQITTWEKFKKRAIIALTGFFTAAALGGAIFGLVILAKKVIPIAMASLAFIPQMYLIPAAVLGGVLVLGAIGVGIYFLYKRIKQIVLQPVGVMNYNSAPMPIFRIEDLLKIHHNKAVSNANDLFTFNNDNQLIATNNFVMRKPNGKVEFAVTPLSKEQKSVYEVLVIQDKLENGKKKFTVVVGDQSTDALFWREQLEKDCSKTKPDEAAKRKRKICLYDLSLGVVKNGAVPFDEENELIKNDDFQAMIAKVKLYNADTYYTPIQQKAVKAMANDPKKLKILKEFFDQAKTWHNSKQKSYSQSWIAKFFDDTAKSKPKASTGGS